MDPKKQECLGKFLYGAGYFARDDNTLALVSGRSSPPHFCSTCPKRTQCEQEHERRVREQAPGAVEAYDRLLAEGRRRGAPPHLLRFLIARDARDPFATVAIENFRQGHADRGQQTGPLVR